MSDDGATTEAARSYAAAYAAHYPERDLATALQLCRDLTGSHASGSGSGLFPNADPEHRKSARSSAGAPGCACGACARPHRARSLRGRRAHAPRRPSHRAHCVAKPCCRAATAALPRLVSERSGHLGHRTPSAAQAPSMSPGFRRLRDPGRRAVLRAAPGAARNAQLGLRGVGGGGGKMTDRSAPISATASESNA